MRAPTDYDAAFRDNETESFRSRSRGGTVRRLSTLILILAANVCGSPAGGQSIGVFFDPEGTICSIHIPPPGPGKGLQLPATTGTAYVIADLGSGTTNACS